MDTKRVKYKSGLEKVLAAGPLKGVPYEPFSLKYTEESTYYPDFVPKNSNILFEAKGRFRDYSEAKKYVAVAKCNPQYRIIFIFQNPFGRAYPQCKKRKDGTILTLAEWAEKNGFEWCTPKTIKKEWLK